MYAQDISDNKTKERNHIHVQNHAMSVSRNLEHDLPINTMHTPNSHEQKLSGHSKYTPQMARKNQSAYRLPLSNHEEGEVKCYQTTEN